MNLGSRMNGRWRLRRAFEPRLIVGVEIGRDVGHRLIPARGLQVLQRDLAERPSLGVVRSGKYRQAGLDTDLTDVLWE